MQDIKAMSLDSKPADGKGKRQVWEEEGAGLECSLRTLSLSQGKGWGRTSPPKLLKAESGLDFPTLLSLRILIVLRRRMALGGAAVQD